MQFVDNGETHTKSLVLPVLKSAMNGLPGYACCGGVVASLTLISTLLVIAGKSQQFHMQFSPFNQPPDV